MRGQVQTMSAAFSICCLNSSPCCHFVVSIHVQVVAVDADAVNLAYIRRSLEKNLLWGNGGVSLIHNAVRWFFCKRYICEYLERYFTRHYMLPRNCSDKSGILYLFNDNSKAKNPAATKMVGKEELEKLARSKEKTGPSSQEGVNAIPLQDLLSSISSPTVVMKMDIEGYECKVNF